VLKLGLTSEHLFALSIFVILLCFDFIVKLAGFCKLLR
jgi:hypothetical protein